jgi:hypothetical protein
VEEEAADGHVERVGARVPQLARRGEAEGEPLAAQFFVLHRYVILSETIG